MSMSQTIETSALVLDKRYPETPVPAARRSRRGILAIGALAVVALAGALTVGMLPRLRPQSEVNADAEEASSAPPRVNVAVARRMKGDAERVLPGNSLPLLEAPLYPRATGYIK